MRSFSLLYTIILGVSLFFHITLKAQTTYWKNQIDILDSPKFSEFIDPDKYHISINKFITQISSWKDNKEIDTDSLFHLVNSWNNYPKPSKTGIVCKYWVQIKKDYKVPYYVYIPKNYNPKNKSILLLYYKGGWLNRTSFPLNVDKEIITDNPTFSYLDAYNIIEIFPALKNDLAIYGFYGYYHMETMIKQTKKLFNINDDKVFLAGFSDGGKSVYNAASSIPNTFACFYPINSFPPSALWYTNFLNRQIYSFSAEKDETVDWKSIYTKAQFVQNLGGQWYFHLLNEKNHFYYPYQDEILPLLFQHMLISARDPLPTKIGYDKSYNDQDLKNVDWLQTTVNTSNTANRYQTLDTLNTYSIDGSESIIEYGKGLGQARASFFNNTYTVTTSQVDSITIYISPIMADVKRPIKVIVNQKVLFDAIIHPSKEFMVEYFLENFDRSQIFVNKISLKITD